MYDMSSMPPVFSPDSKYIFYVLQDYKNNKSILFVSDTETGEVKESTAYDNVGAVTFNPDRSKFVYTASKENKYFIAKSSFAAKGKVEKEGPPYELISEVIFSPDGRSIVYVVTKEGKKILVVTDHEMIAHRESHGYDDIYTPVKFTPDGEAVLFRVQSGGEILWKVEKVE